MAASLEPIFIVYSRTGLMDGIQLFFIIACFGIALAIKRPRQMIALAIFLGLAASIKWVALCVIVPTAYIAWRKGLFKEFVISLPITVLVYLAIVFSGQVVIGTPNPLEGVILWHQQAWQYQLTLTATHPWSSKWYTWPIMTRPVLFRYDVNPNGTIQMMSAIGNPVLWWVSSVAVVASLVEIITLAALRQKIADHPLVPLLVGYAAAFLPWIPIHRVLFLYHYLPCYFFALMMVGYWFSKIWKRFPPVALTFAIVVFGVGVYFLPLAMGLPLSQNAINQHIWVNSWLYG